MLGPLNVDRVWVIAGYRMADYMRLEVQAVGSLVRYLWQEAWLVRQLCHRTGGSA